VHRLEAVRASLIRMWLGHRWKFNQFLKITFGFWDREVVEAFRIRDKVTPWPHEGTNLRVNPRVGTPQTMVPRTAASRHTPANPPHKVIPPLPLP
jgi:hypothetical protein